MAQSHELGARVERQEHGTGTGADADSHPVGGAAEEGEDKTGGDDEASPSEGDKLHETRTARETEPGAETIQIRISSVIVPPPATVHIVQRASKNDGARAVEEFVAVLPPITSLQ